MTFQELILSLNKFWSERGFVIQQPYDLEVGAGTFNPATFLRVLGPEPYNVAYVEPSRRPTDGRYGENPNRLQHYYQYQVIAKPSPPDSQGLYLESLRSFGIDPLDHDIRFVEDDWESPTLGASGLGWEVWLDGMEVTQFTYFQQVGGIALGPVSLELTYGLERIAMYLQGVDNVYDLVWSGNVKYGDVHHQGEVEWSRYNFEEADVDMLLKLFNMYEAESLRLLDKAMVLPGYDYTLKCSPRIQPPGRQGCHQRDGTHELHRPRARHGPPRGACLCGPARTNGIPAAQQMGRQIEIEETMRDAFYLEIGTEEVPAGYIQPALEAMSAQMVRFLDESRIAHGAPCFTGTPRRLMLYIPDVASDQEACTTEVFGPPKQVAFDAQGKPTKAAEGFARGQGVTLESVLVKATPKGEYLCVVREEAGLPARELLEKMLPDFIARIPFPKSMRWGSQSVTFARPVQWIVALLGKQVLDFGYGALQSGDKSLGHRFLSPEWLTVTDFESHLENLKKHHVIAGTQERKDFIRNAIVEAAKKVGGRILEDEELLDEVTQIVEFPYPIVGEFEEKYLELPPELLITVIKKHQRYFAVIDEKGDLLRYFVTVANTVPRDPRVVAAGNGRVVRARLEDARFYYKEDQKTRLESRAEQLKAVVFHTKLGTSWEKVERFTALARWLARDLAPSSMETIHRAAHLCKADLVTGVVGEFPELQGVMGRVYARLQGEPESVARAIFEHYLPVRAGGPVPESVEGALLSIADKMDTITACFGVGLIPSGTADPFALRRQTLGIIRIVLERPLRISLRDLVNQALPLLGSKMTEPADTVRQGVLDFFQGRLHHLLVQEGLSPDVVEASLAVGIDDLVDAVSRTRALARFKERPDFESLAAAFKRVVNIIKEPETTPVEPELLRSTAENSLFTALRDTEGVVAGCLAGCDYASALEAMSGLKGFIDGFFDAVLVMDKDEAIRRNRLALLTRIRTLFSQVADFRKIQTA